MSTTCIQFTILHILYISVPNENSLNNAVVPNEVQSSKLKGKSGVGVASSEVKSPSLKAKSPGVGAIISEVKPTASSPKSKSLGGGGGDKSTTSSE